jgi:sugar lactone lactonase YvrE
VVPGKKPEVYASGFTNISDLAFEGRDLLVLEIAAKGLTDPKLAGALLRVSPDGRQSVVVGNGLTAPTGLAVSAGRIYVSDCGVCPSRGPGPHGRLVTVSG